MPLGRALLAFAKGILAKSLIKLLGTELLIGKSFMLPWLLTELISYTCLRPFPLKSETCSVMARDRWESQPVSVWAPPALCEVELESLGHI